MITHTNNDHNNNNDDNNNNNDKNNINNNNNNNNDNKISNNTFCTFQMEIIVKVRAPTLNNKMSATGTPKTSKSVFPFEIQQSSSAIEGEN